MKNKSKTVCTLYWNKLKIGSENRTTMYKSVNTKETMFPDSIREDEEDSDVETGK